MMKTKFLLTGSLFILIISANTYSQDWGIGVRVGDPTGISLKKHMDGKALELNVGITHLFYGKGFYDKGFNDWYRDENFKYEDYEYDGYSSSVPFGVQLHYLIQKKISKVAEEQISGLEWYFGFGAQIRFQNYTYDYRYKMNGDWYYDTERVFDFDFGADAVIGLEYTFEKIPISVFLDAITFLEFFDNPFRPWFQGGTGGRYRF